MVYVNTNKYEFSHGKMPRGYGNWGFFMGVAAYVKNDFNNCFWHTGTYAEAKRMAKTYAIEHKVDEVIVAP